MGSLSMRQQWVSLSTHTHTHTHTHRLFYCFYAPVSTSRFHSAYDRLVSYRFKVLTSHYPCHSICLPGCLLLFHPIYNFTSSSVCISVFFSPFGRYKDHLISNTFLLFAPCFLSPIPLFIYL